MRAKFNKFSIFGTTSKNSIKREQAVKYLRHVISVRIDTMHFELFDIVARAYNLYYLMIFAEAFELIRLNFHEYTIIVQKNPYQIIIEIKKKP